MDLVPSCANGPVVASPLRKPQTPNFESGVSLSTRARSLRILALFVLGAVSTIGCSGSITEAVVPPPPPPPSPPPPPTALWAPATVLGGGSFFGAAGQGSDLHVVYGEGGTIRYRGSRNEGATFGAEFFVNIVGTPMLENPLVVSGNTVILDYFEISRTLTDFIGPRPVGDLFVVISRDRGVTWRAPTQLSTGQAAFRQALAISGNTVHVAWMDYRRGAWDLYYRRSVDLGATWEPERLLVVGAPVAGAERPMLAVKGNSVHLAWMDGRDGKGPLPMEGGFSPSQSFEVYYKRSLDGGATWGADVRLTNEMTAYNGRPNVAMPSLNIVLISYDHTYGVSTAVQLLRSSDNGATFAPSVRLTNAPGDQTHSTMAVDGAGGAHIVWDDGRSGPYQIWYRTSRDGGATWAPEEQVSASGTASAPLSGVSAGYFHALWIADDQVVTRRRRIP